MHIHPAAERALEEMALLVSRTLGPSPHFDLEVCERPGELKELSCQMFPTCKEGLWGIRIFGDEVEYMLDKGAHLLVLFQLFHELIHPYNVELWREASRTPWSDFLYETQDTSSPKSIWESYTHWGEGSVDAVMVMIAAQAIPESRRMVTRVFGSRRRFNSDYGLSWEGGIAEGPNWLARLSPFRPRVTLSGNSPVGEPCYTWLHPDELLEKYELITP